MKKSAFPYGLLLLAFVIATVCIVHVWRMPQVPAGLYQDETAIGENALLVAESGKDEHGVLLPVYFASFGDYKSPVYIYGVTLLTKFFGPSALTVRFTSALFFFAFLAGLLLLVSRLWPGMTTLTYAAIAGGTLPWIFTISRIGFEVIAQPTFIIWALLLLHAALHAKFRRQILWWTATGVALGFSVYTYATARLLSVLLLLSILCVFVSRRNWKNLAACVGGFFAALMPYAIFALQKPGALTARFRDISFFFNDDLSVWEKITTFVANTIAHFDLEFLLLKGDGNLRHATGFGGMIFVTVLILAIIGIVDLLSRGRKIDRFSVLILSQLLLTPLAAGMTDDGIPHALRTVLLGLYLLLLSCAGFWAVLRLRHSFARFCIAAVLFFALTLEAGLFMRYYFGPYVEKSADFFDSSGLPEAIAEGLERHPRRIVITDELSYVTARFFGEAARNPGKIPIESGKLKKEPGTCFVGRGPGKFPRMHLTCFP